MSTRMQLLCVILIGLSLAAVTAHWRRPTEQKVTDGSRYFAYCPECYLEIAIPAEMSAKINYCPHCGAGRKMEVNTFSRTNGEGPPLAANRLLIAALFGVPAALAIGLYSFGRVKERRNFSADGDAFQFTCPGCGHTMASNSYRKGSTAVCPVCAELFVVTGSDDGNALDRPEKEHDLQDKLRSALRKKPTKPKRRK